MYTHVYLLFIHTYVYIYIYVFVWLPFFSSLAGRAWGSPG